MFHFSQVYFCNTYLFNSFAVEVVLPAHTASSYTLLESTLSENERKYGSQWCKCLHRCLILPIANAKEQFLRSPSPPAFSSPLPPLIISCIRPHAASHGPGYTWASFVPNSGFSSLAPHVLQSPPAHSTLCTSRPSPTRCRFGVLCRPKACCTPPASKQADLLGKPSVIPGAGSSFLSSKSLMKLLSFH